MRFKKITDISDNTLLDLLLKKMEAQAQAIIEKNQSLSK